MRVVIDLSPPQVYRGLIDYAAGLAEAQCRVRVAHLARALIAELLENDELKGSLAFTPTLADAAREGRGAFNAEVGELARYTGYELELARQLAILAEGAPTTAAISNSGEAASHARKAAKVFIDWAESSC